MSRIFSNRVIKGNEMARGILEGLKMQLEASSSSASTPPRLSILMAGESVASQSYVRKKMDSCRKIGIEAEIHRFNEHEQDRFIQRIQELNLNPRVTGILTQLPLPGTYNKDLVLSHISPGKDIDCLHSHNLSMLFQYGEKAPVLPCTPQAVLHVFDQHKIELKGKKVAMIGRSNLVGLPLGLLMIKRNATVTMCHSHSRQHLDQIILNSDIVVSAAGVANLVSNTKPGACIIDIGISSMPGSTAICGDVDRQNITNFQILAPTPGGIGPLTVAMLMRNIVKLWRSG